MNPALRRSAAHVFVESLAAPVLDPVDVHHLLRVLRLRSGEIISVSDGRGSWRSCRIGTDGVLEADGDIVKEARTVAELTVAFAIPKGDRPEWIVQKLTEIGIDRIIVLQTERSIVRWDQDKARRQLPRLTKVAREAAMQSRRVRLPDLVGPMTPAAVLAAVPAAGPGDGSGVALAEPDGRPVQPATTTILVGPEGGWSDAELAVCPQRIGLGATILRVETAALAAGVLLTMAHGQAVTTGDSA